MALDLNRILLYGRPDGTIAEEPVRRIISIVDAIVAGQSEGPLAPEPLPLGCILAGDDSPAIDWIGSALLGLDPSRIPIVRQSFSSFSYPLTRARPEEVRAVWNGRGTTGRDLAREIGRRALPPAGWLGHCEAV